MNRLLCSTAAIIAVAATSAPASAQDMNDAAAELAQMRVQLAAMNTRIAELEARLAAEQADIGEAIADARAPAADAEAAAETVRAAMPTDESGRAAVVKSAPATRGDGGWSFKPFGRLQYDAGATSVPDATGRSDGWGNELRRARLGVTGDMPDGFAYKIEVDFAGNEVEITDAIVAYGTGDLEITLGQHNNFQSLEELTSSRFLSLLERAAFTDAFGFERRVGVSAQYKGDLMLVQGGVFTDNIGDLSNRNWSVDGRIVAMPRLGTTRLHFGGSAHYAEYEAGTVLRYRQRPQVHFTPERFVDTGGMSAQSETGFGLEAAAIAGRFHAASEAFWQTVDRPGALSDPTFFGGYAEAGLFLTGDTRGYKGGKFDRVKPTSPVGEGGIGAVQIVLRYDYLDLDSGAILGGRQTGYLASLIWTPTDYTRLMLDYGRIEFDGAAYAGPAGSTSYGADVVGVRGQVDF
ncbi:OprO/OprP family phosphate-selective porin [Pseudoblastomonas halimionae]|uniref:Porin n=1 Tax=Alteriqipengyuania halimionae TaxID=1926630 RepID=A0A6I4U368_9SPHN|nr:porin [Alteriqipengyuania halimionae]MXP08647.1 hypothetical protein [Alteriqipengyuania halimionae]